MVIALFIHSQFFHALTEFRRLAASYFSCLRSRRLRTALLDVQYNLLFWSCCSLEFAAQQHRFRFRDVPRRFFYLSRFWSSRLFRLGSLLYFRARAHVVLCRSFLCFSLSLCLANRPSAMAVVRVHFDPVTISFWSPLDLCKHAFPFVLFAQFSFVPFQFDSVFRLDCSTNAAAPIRIPIDSILVHLFFRLVF